MSIADLEAASQETWLTLIGIAKYLSRTQETHPRTAIQQKLGIGDRPLEIGLHQLSQLGYWVNSPSPDLIEIRNTQPPEGDNRPVHQLAQPFLEAVCEEQFRQRYRILGTLKNSSSRSGADSNKSSR